MDLERVLVDVETLVRMCHSKNDGASLIMEEEDVETKISDIKAEIDEIKIAMEEDTYDTSAEMADRNIEIILKKLIQTLTSELKVKKDDLTSLCNEEHILNEKLELIKAKKKNCENYISVAQDRIIGNLNSPVSERYSSEIELTKNNLVSINLEIEEETKSYNELQNQIEQISKEVAVIEEKIANKKDQLAETQANLENKDYYINTSKKSKNERKIKELEARKQKLEERLNDIRKDPKYLEIKIRRKLSTSDDKFEAKNYVLTLIEEAKKVPFIERDADATLEEELLKATQERDEFATLISTKTYNILENVSPSQIRINFLKAKMDIWNKEIVNLEAKASVIDNDGLFNYQEKSVVLNNLINEKKADIAKYTEELKNEEDESHRTTLKVLLDDTKKDLNETERIYNAFKIEETNDIKEADMIVKTQIVDLKNKIAAAEEEINETYKRLQTSSNGLVDITAQNKDKELLKELAQVVVNIKHRRLFSEKPSEIAERLLKNIDLLGVETQAVDNQSSATENPNISSDETVANSEKVEQTSNINQESISEENIAVAEETSEAIEAPTKNDTVLETPETLEASESETLENNVENTPTQEIAA